MGRSKGGSMNTENTNLKIGRILEHQYDEIILLFDLIDVYIDKLKRKELIGEDRERMLFFLGMTAKQLESYFRVKDVYIELTNIMLENPNLFNDDKDLKESSLAILNIINSMNNQYIPLYLQFLNFSVLKSVEN